MNESINNQENKTKFRELVKKYHPDNKETGNEDMMKKLNQSKESDKDFEAFYNELIAIKKPVENATDVMSKRPKRFKTDEEWFKWLKAYEKVKARREKEQEKVRTKQRR